MYQPPLDIEDTTNEEDVMRISKRQWILIAVGIIVLGIGAYLFYELNAIKLFTDYFDWVSRNTQLGILIHCLIIVFLGITSIPGLKMMFLGAGFLFKPLYLSMIINATSIFVGVTIAMLLARYLFAEWVRHKVKRVWKLNEIRIVIQESSQMTFLLRLALPLPLGTYVFAIMDFDWAAYWTGTVVCVLLRTLPESFLGFSLTDIIELTQPMPGQDNRLKFTILLITLVLQGFIAICVGLWVSSALDLVEDGEMKHEMSWKRFDSRRKKYLVITTVLSLFLLTLGPILLWTLDRFKPR